MSNAQKFIAAGGRAVWKMTRFDHNAHQIDQARQLAKDLGFQSHDLVDHGRSNSPVYNKQKQLMHVIGTVPHTDFQVLWDERFKSDIQFKRRDIESVSCKAQNKKELYISSTGDVYPCCFLGYNPKTFERGMNTYYNQINQELAPMVVNNNALTNTLEQCIEWFNQIPPTWNTDPLLACNDFCGSKSLYLKLPT
jgi:MoaA/NifB/PqqE/SkfB family radical SAM enzyme